MCHCWLKNFDFHQLALTAAKDLPRDPAQATRAKLREIVSYPPGGVAVSKAGQETRGGIQAVFWKLRVSDPWTIPVTELTLATLKTTAVVIADAGRKNAAKEIEVLLNSGHRVLAVDPTFMGEASLGARTYLHILLVATLGQRALGIEAAQVAAVSNWCLEMFGTKPAIHTIGPRQQPRRASRESDGTEHHGRTEAHGTHRGSPRHPAQQLDRTG